MTELTKFFVDREAPDYYYIKKPQTLIELGPVPHPEDLTEIANYCVENKNPLNLFVLGTNYVTYNITKLPHDFYSWPIPFCFTWPQHRVGALEGITLLRIAQQFWNNIASIKTDPDHPEGFIVLNGEIRLYPPGSATPRIVDNPGGPKGIKWFEGGSCRCLVPLTAPTGAKIVSGSLSAPDTLTLEQGKVYEFNNTVPFKYVNDSDSDWIMMHFDLIPVSKAEECEARLLAHPIFGQLHVSYAAGFPVHPTLHL